MARSLSDEAYIAIKRMVVTLELAPGAALDETALQDQLGIGRTPIREAIQRLERDQFLKVAPRRGVFVTSVDVSELSLLFETRSMIEPYAARLAAERGTEHLWNEMSRALNELDGSADPVAALGADRRCHEVMWEAAQNRFLTDTLEMLYAQSERVWHLYVRSVVRNGVDMAHVIREHYEVLSVLRAKKAAAAERLMRSHVQAFHDEIRSAAALAR